MSLIRQHAMATHYIYDDDLDRDCLCQGDVLRKTPELVEILKKYRFHHTEHDYSYFLVLTQSCDLVRRGGKAPSSHYVTLAAVRPVEDAIRREAMKYQESWQVSRKVLASRAFDELLLFTESLVDNNVASYFYLHEDLSFDVSGQNCGFLALSTALPVEHYERCLKAKIAQLKGPFQAKLGWLVGNMYSRVGTQEWDHSYGINSARKTASKLLKEVFEIISDERIKQGLSELEQTGNLDDYTDKEKYECVRKKKIIPNRTRFAERIEERISDTCFVDSVCDHIVAAIQNDRELTEETCAILKESGVEETEVLGNRLETLFINALRKFLTDATLPRREKVVTRIGAAISQDTVVKQLLRPG